MKRNFLLILCLLFFHNSFCQNTIWHEVRIDSFLTVSLPGNIVIIDTSITQNGKISPAKVFTVTASSSTIVLTVGQGGRSVNPYKPDSDLKKAREEFKKGFRESIESNGYSVDIKDTVVNDVHGFKGDVFADESKTSLSIICYSFCVNSLSYSFMVAPSNSNVVERNENVDKLVRSIRFNKENILLNTGNNELSINYQKLGELTGILLIAGVIIFAVYRNNKRKNQAGNKKNEL